MNDFSGVRSFAFDWPYDLSASSAKAGPSQSRRRKSVSSTSSAPKRRKSESPASSPGGSVGSPEPSIGEQISQMSAAPFASGLEDIFSTPFGLETVVEDGCKECLACGYRYLSLEQLADHQRIHHSLAEVIL
ncbi:hypothetical protein AC579_2711 [Pseudocercospora musae]|uniref:C2H2-type domain-containing protein n=1 Tax=Pseudocercospora musae TaxID=113226 RepID=A0A139IVT9_9PEZI|nr:hypothetical protein AC579_2711 [Pseudocercospora musae]